MGIMAYLKPPAFVAMVFNPLAMKFGIGGAETLTVKGRSTGKTQSIPVIPIDVDGTKYVVSTRGEAQWVLNLRAAETLQIHSKGKTANYRATEVPVSERDQILAAYRHKAGKTVESYWKSLPNAKDHPAFRLDPL